MFIFRASTIYVRLGASSSGDEGETVAATKFTPHPKYSRKTYDYDIGIITLDSPVKIDGVKTKIVRLANKGTQVKPGQNVTVTGWGATSVSYILYC